MPGLKSPALHSNPGAEEAALKATPPGTIDASAVSPDDRDARFGGAMQRVLSTYRYVKHPLTSALLGEIARAGINSVEIFCAPSHFDYRAPQTAKELAQTLDEHGLALHSLHSPTERDLAPGRESGVALSISDTERIRRIDAVDEVKRALEIAERIPFRYLVQHICHGRQSADPRKFDAAFNSLELLVVFAKARGVTIALENTPGELSSPASLHEFIKETHLRELRLCFDIGHAHIEEGVLPSFEIMRDAVVTTHLHDNHGEKDEHLLPYEGGPGGIDWDEALAALSSATQPLPLVMELKEQAAGKPALAEIRAAFDRLEGNLEEKRAQAARP
jgi:sugar phosphate isomerase/epimerase